VVLLSSGNSKEKRLRLSSKAVILNDIENMHVDQLFCIVGFPNISKFASITDPIVSGDDVQQFLQKLNQCEHSSAGNSFNQQSVMSNSMMMQQVAQAPSHHSIPDLPQSDTDADDLHLYEFKDVLLQKKERLMLPIFDLEVSYKDIYHCRIDASQSQMARVYSGYTEKKDYEEVRLFIIRFIDLHLVSP
jgi:hypothetical protein